MTKRLNERVSIITGGASGIGKSAARLFAEEGSIVVVNDRRPDAADALIAEIEAAGGRACYRAADLSSMHEARDLVGWTVEQFGRIDIVINNAAYFPKRANILDVSLDDWERTLRTNLYAAQATCAEAIPYMKSQGGGVMVATASVHGLIGSPAFYAYDILKAALISQTRSIAVDFGAFGIRANAICPAAVMTEAYLEAHSPERRQLDRLVYPLRRLAEPIEIARIALFLASDDSSFVTGTTIVADGGMTAQLPDELYSGFEAFYRKKFAKEWGVAI